MALPDILPSANGHGWDELCAYIEEIEIDGRSIKLLGLEGLLLTKEGARDKDRMDATVLRASLHKLKGE